MDIRRTGNDGAMLQPSTWAMTRSAHRQAAERAITETEIARVLVDPDAGTPDAGKANIVTLIRSGLVLIVDEADKTLLAVIEVNPRARARAQEDDPGELPVKIRRRPVSDRPVPAPSFPPPPDKDAHSMLAGVNSRRAPVVRPAPATPFRKHAADSRVLDGVHPVIAAGVKAELERRGLDFRHVVVHSPTNVEIR